MNNSIDDCFLDKSNSKECLGDNPEEKLLKMITTLYELIEKKEKIYLETNEYTEDEITKIKLYINNLLKHVKFYINLDEEDQEEANATAVEEANKAKTAVEEANAAAVEEANKAKTAAETANSFATKAKNLLTEAKAKITENAANAANKVAEANAAAEAANKAAVAAVAAAEAANKAANKAAVAANTAVVDAQKAADAAVAAAEEANTANKVAEANAAAEAANKAADTAVATVKEAKRLVTEATNLLAEAEAANKAEEAVVVVEEEANTKKQVQLVKSVSESLSPASSQSLQSSSSQSSSLARASQSQLESTKNTTGLQLSDNKFAVDKTNRKFIINLIKILNFGLDTKITNNNTTNINENFNQKINNIVQQNNNIIHALYGNNSNNTTINFGNENTIVKPLFLTDGIIYNNNSDKINNYYTPLFGIDKDNNFQSIPNSGENNNLITYKLILFMIKFDYIGLNKYNNIYDDNNIKSINYLDKRYNTLNNNKFLKITDNIYKINKKYYYDYTSDNIQKHIIKKVVV